MKKVIFVLFLMVGMPSTGLAVDFDEGDTWISNRPDRVVSLYRQTDRVKTMSLMGQFEEGYDFLKAGRDHYTAYDYETGNLLELTIRRDGGWEVFDYETGDFWLIGTPPRRE